MPDFIVPFDQLPKGFAENVAHPPVAPVATRPAATILLVRDGGGGPGVLLMRRGRSAGFVPGAYVFPGGRVDRSDAEPHVVEHLDGLDEAVAAERLDLAGGDPPALAYYLAALREAFEETGILVARLTDGTPPPTAAEDPAVDALRDDLMEDRVTFAEVLDRLRCRLDGGAVEYVAHWITPEVEPRRYDTRFFAAKVPEGSDAVGDSRAMTDAVWLAPARALERFHEGSLPMVFPTIRTLSDLSRFPSVDAVLAHFRTVSVPTIMPRLVMTPTGVGTEVDS